MPISTSQIQALVSSEPILIVEDKKENQDLLVGLCKVVGVPCEVAENGEVALTMAETKSYSLYVVDLMMPVMDGQTFIGHIRKKDPNAVILVQTALDSSETVIQVMKMGVFDYIIKPIEPQLFHDTLFKGLELVYLRRFEREQGLAAGLKIRNQIEWLSYKDSLRISSGDSTDTKSIYNLKTSLAQGAGFGSLLTLIDMMMTTAEKHNDRYHVESQIYDMICENTEYCRLQLDGLNTAAEIMERDIPLAVIDAATLIGSLPEWVSKISKFFGEKNLTITFPELRDNCKLSYNAERLAIVCEELVVNAYKYSVPGSTINIYTRISEGYFWVSFKNDVLELPYGGVPEKYEKLVCEPFFRIQPPDESAARFERIGFGLGLSVADYVLKKHNGLFIIHDVKDLTKDKSRLCVLAEILLPVQ